jgi:cysteinyl-tRNA synthetase
MAAQILTPHFDIHCGGMDLIFPHHENEIAQSEAAFGAPFARVWLHTGFLNVDAEKMSKSLGNFVTIPQLLERNDPEGVRYFLLGQHYRSPVSFDIDRRATRVVFPGIDEAERRVDYLYLTREALVAAAGDEKPDVSGSSAQAKVIREAVERVLTALDDDLNTSVALSIIGELAKAGNDVAIKVGRLKKDPAAQATERALAAAAVEALDACCKPLGLMLAPPALYFGRTRALRLRLRGLEEGALDAKVQERTAARAAKDFARGDAIRDELLGLGVELKDAPDGGGTTWRVVT